MVGHVAAHSYVEFDTYHVYIYGIAFKIRVFHMARELHGSRQGPMGGKLLRSQPRSELQSLLIGDLKLKIMAFNTFTQVSVCR